MKKENYPSWLVPIETAKELKEIGFKESCVFTCKDNKLNIELFVEEYIPFISKVYILKTNADKITNIDFDFYIPTWTQAFDWFLERGIPSHIEWVEEGRFKFVYRTDKTCGKVKWVSFECSNLLEAREEGLKKLIRHYKEVTNIINVDNKTKGVFPLTPEDCFESVI